MSPSNGIRVTSDVRRDLLASAAAFKNEASVVWEYVVNSLQYVDRGTAPRVQVTVRPRLRQIEISDNGRGMEDADLERYFRMHVENLDRLQGRPGRGKFGTGKSAAFGIAKTLRVDTRRGGLRNAVELTREMIDRSSGDDIPLNWQVRNEASDLANGTTITISDIVLGRINTSSIVEYVERHLQAFRGFSPQVAVNDHVCEYREPAVAEEFLFRPTAEQARLLGDVELTLRVAQAPLPDADQGVRVTAGPGNLVAIERAGIERKEFGSYLFGTVDVASLDSYQSPIEPYDFTRSLSLNPSHPVAAAIIAFVGSKLEEVRLGLVLRQREARRTAQSRLLAKEAEKIAEILNSDFQAVRQRLMDIRSAASTRGPATSTFGDSQEGGGEQGEWVEGTQIPGVLAQAEKPHSSNGGSGRPTPHVTRSGTPDERGAAAVDPVGGGGEKRAKPRGGFRVDYRNLGAEELRSTYDRGALVILINLDHPVVAAALGDGNVEDVAFRRLSYEIAFSEYSLALGYEMAQQDPDIPPDDLLYEVRASLNRVAGAAVVLYGG